MADSEIQILVRAIDEASGTLKNIENSVKTTADKSSEANEKLGDSFTKVQGAMLNLGQIAQGVHNIFEIQENSTRRLENAQDRLENATIRLQQANENLAIAEQKVNDIEKAHARDNLTLERAQLNLEDAQNNLRDAIDKYGATALETRKANLQLKEAQADLTDAQDLGNQKAKELTKSQEELKNKQDAITVASNNVDRAQRQLEKTIGDAKWAYVDMGMQLLSTIGNMGTFINTMKEATVVSKLMTGIGGLGGVSAFLTGPLGIAIGLATVALGTFFITQQNDSKTASDSFVSNEQGALNMINQLEASANRADQALGNLLARQNIVSGVSKRETIQSSGPSLSTAQQADIKSFMTPSVLGGQSKLSEMLNPTISNTSKSSVSSISASEMNRIISMSNYIGKTTKVGDAIIRPNGQVIQTDPNDTLFASKNGMGKSIIINVTGPIYGVSPQQISKALSDELNKKLSL